VNRGNIEIVAITHTVAGSSKIVDESRESHMVWVRVKVGVARRPGPGAHTICTASTMGEHKPSTNREVLSWCVDQMFLFHHNI
jgi:hypothetical protein